MTVDHISDQVIRIGKSLIEKNAMHGFLNINKPSGMTSRTVVDAVLRIVGKGCKIGHAGTLDPLAAGVLVVATGEATRLIEYVHRGPKEYLATFLLGVTSASDDLDSPLTPVPSVVVPSREAIAAAGLAMCGRIMQRPPAFSAIKLDGKRCYDRARRGELVEIPPRPVDIYAFELLENTEHSQGWGATGSEGARFAQYPQIRFRLRCGSGTYVRSFGRDLAQRLGTRAVMASLTRTAVGPFGIKRAIRLPDVLKFPNIRRGEPPLSSEMETLRNTQIASALRLFQAALRPVEWGVTYLPRMVLPTALGRQLQMGQVVSFTKCEENQALVVAPSVEIPKDDVASPEVVSDSTASKCGTIHDEAIVLDKARLDETMSDTVASGGITLSNATGPTSIFQTMIHGGTLHRDRQQDGSNAIAEAAIAVFDPSGKLMSVVAPFHELHGYRAIRNFPPPSTSPE